MQHSERSAVRSDPGRGMRRGDHQHLDNDGHHDYDANDDNHGDNDGNDDQQMNIVGQFSHSQVEEEDCSGVAADSGAVCGDFPLNIFPFFSQFVHIFILLRSMKTALRLFVTLSRLRSATQSEFQHKYKNCKHKVSKSTKL